jgi:hypothetical protein
MGGNPRIVDELRRFERLCLELADDSTMSAERVGLLEMVGNCRAEISDRERANRFAHTVPTQSFL